MADAICHMLFTAFLTVHVFQLYKAFGKRMKGFCKENSLLLEQILPPVEFNPRLLFMQTRALVVQSIISLTSSLRGQLVKCFKIL